MFDKLIDYLIGIIDQVNPIFIIKDYEQAVLLRKGRFKKILEPGVHLKWPFFDMFISQHTMLTTLTLPAQSLVTFDDNNIVIKSVVKFKIVDVKVFCLELFDSVDAISDISQVIIKEVIMNSEWDKCISNDLDNVITKKVRSEIKKYGVFVEHVTLTNIAKIRTIRLINETGQHL